MLITRSSKIRAETPWHNDLVRGLKDGFGESGLKVNITTEFLDANFWTYQSEKLIMRRFCERSRERGTDLIVTVSDEAFHTLLTCGDSLALQLPVVFFNIKYPYKENVLYSQNDIKNYDEKETLKISLIENLQREDLNPIEEAKAYEQLYNTYGLKQDEIAASVSKSRTAITNIMRLLKLDERVQNMVIENLISSGHGRTLLSIDDGDVQYQLAEKILDENLSVREA